MEVNEENFISHVVGKLLVAVGAIDGHTSEEEITTHSTLIQAMTGVNHDMQGNFYTEVEGMTLDQIVDWTTAEINVITKMDPNAQSAVIGMLIMQAMADGVEHPLEQAFILTIKEMCENANGSDGI